MLNFRHMVINAILFPMPIFYIYRNVKKGWCDRIE